MYMSLVVYLFGTQCRFVQDERHVEYLVQRSFHKNVKLAHSHIYTADRSHYSDHEIETVEDTETWLKLLQPSNMLSVLVRRKWKT